MDTGELKKSERWKRAQVAEAEHFLHSGWQGLAAYKPKSGNPIAHLPVDDKFFQSKDILAVGCDPLPRFIISTMPGRSLE